MSHNGKTRARITKLNPPIGFEVKVEGAPAEAVRTVYLTREMAYTALGRVIVDRDHALHAAYSGAAQAYAALGSMELEREQRLEEVRGKDEAAKEALYDLVRAYGGNPSSECWHLDFSTMILRHLAVGATIPPAGQPLAKDQAPVEKPSESKPVSAKVAEA